MQKVHSSKPDRVPLQCKSAELCRNAASFFSLRRPDALLWQHHGINGNHSLSRSKIISLDRDTPLPFYLNSEKFNDHH